MIYFIKKSNENSMGNTIYADVLKGMTVEEARQFISKNNVYFNANNSNYKICVIRIVSSIIDDIDMEHLSTMDYCRNRLNVGITNGIITTIKDMG